MFYKSIKFDLDNRPKDLYEFLERFGSLSPCGIAIYHEKRRGTPQVIHKGQIITKNNVIIFTSKSLPKVIYLHEKVSELKRGDEIIIEYAQTR
jgi:hypothetical protein